MLRVSFSVFDRPILIKTTPDTDLSILYILKPNLSETFPADLTEWLANGFMAWTLAKSLASCDYKDT